MNFVGRESHTHVDKIFGPLGNAVIRGATFYYQPKEATRNYSLGIMNTQMTAVAREHAHQAMLLSTGHSV